MPRKRYVGKNTKRSRIIRSVWKRRKTETSNVENSSDQFQDSEDAFQNLFDGSTTPNTSSFRSTVNKTYGRKPFPQEYMETCQSTDEEASNDNNLQELIIEPMEVPEENFLSGRRVVDINHIFKEITFLTSHHKVCTMGKYEFVKEVPNGLFSNYIFYCDNCHKEYILSSEPQETKNEVNNGLVWGAISIGVGHAQIEELFGLLDVPIMGPKKFRAHELKIGKVWEETLIKKMKDNAEEEKRIATEKGNIFNGKPYITVIGDGGWGKRSYGHGMNSSSGVGVVIGAETKKILFLGVRNKFCYVCSKAKRKKTEVPQHECFVNYTGPSTGMESSVIVQAFKRSEEDYGLMYKYYIGDGDSSVFARVQECCRYGRFVTKVECANHMTRALSDNLHKLASNTKFPLDSRRILLGVPEGKSISRLERLVKGVRTAIKEAGPSKGLQEVQNLRKDLMNAPNHVLGDHSSCRDTFCKLDTDQDTNLINVIDKDLLTEMRKLVDKMVRRADTLVLNATTNCAERYMGLVSKFIGGKRVNHAARGSYGRRCYAAGLSHTSGPSWHFSPWKTLHGRSPGRIMKRRLLAREKVRSRRALRFSTEKPQRRKKRASGYDKEYGPLAIEPDMSEDELKAKMQSFQTLLRDESQEWAEIERKTVGQHDNPLWHEKKMNRLTASKFGAVIKRKEDTSCHNLVKSILYPRDLNCKAVVFGRVHEKDAIKIYEERSGNTVEDCGLFCSTQYPYLGASPDGLVGEDGLVEVKCLPSVTDKLEVVLANKKNTTCLEIGDNNQITIKKKHNYYYQIQGQLNITNRNWCDFVVYTPHKRF